MKMRIFDLLSNKILEVAPVAAYLAFQAARSQHWATDEAGRDFHVQPFLFFGGGLARDVLALYIANIRRYGGCRLPGVAAPMRTSGR